MYDIIIIGAGPAGMSAAVYSARKKLKTLVLSKDIGGQTALSSDVENYLGFHMITGADLAHKFEEHLRDFEEIELRQGVEVEGVEKKKNFFSVKVKGSDTFETKAVIITSGKAPRKLGVPGEEKYTGKGVTYCATCDAPLFSNKDVAVIGGGNSALDATLQLTKIAKSIHLLTDESDFSKSDQIMFEKVKKDKKTTLHYNTETLHIDGDAFVKSITLQNGKEQKISVEGVFIEIGSVPAVKFLNGFLELNKKNEIIINERNETSVPGVFAAGDVTTVPEKQVIVAAGEGAKAAIMAFSYLARK